MKSRLLIILLFNLFIFSGIGQNPTFTYILSTPQDEEIVDVIENEFGEFICVGFISEPGSFNNPRQGLILKLDANGKLIDSTILMLSDKSYKIRNILQDTAGTFITVETHRDTTIEPNSEIAFKRFNYSLEVLNSGQYEFYYPYLIGEVYPSIGYNNDILISGSIWPYSQPYFLMLSMRFNQSFEHIRSEMQYDASSGNGVKQLNDSTYWFFVGLDYGTMFLLTDTLFNELQWQYTNDDVYDRVGIKWDTDSTFYLSGPNNGDIGISRQFHPLDTSGRINNSWGTIDTLDVTANNGPLDFQNKDSIFIGGTTNPWTGGPYPQSYFSLIQTDSLLQVRWEKFFGGDAVYEMNRVIATNDGGCLMAGIIKNVDSNFFFVDNDVVIIKVNSQGIIVGSSESLSDINTCEAIIYPNPGDDIIHVRIAAQYKESVFELFDINAKLILKQKLLGSEGVVNISFLDNGTYVYKITSKNSLLKSGKWIKK